MTLGFVYDELLEIGSGKDAPMSGMRLWFLIKRGQNGRVFNAIFALLRVAVLQI